MMVFFGRASANAATTRAGAIGIFSQRARRTDSAWPRSCGSGVQGFLLSPLQLCFPLTFQFLSSSSRSKQERDNASSPIRPRRRRITFLSSCWGSSSVLHHGHPRLNQGLQRVVHEHSISGDKNEIYARHIFAQSLLRPSTLLRTQT